MLFARFMRLGVALAALLAFVALASPSAHAYPEWATKEKVKCGYCHLQPGGPRGFRGMYYKAHKLSFANFDEVYEAKVAGVKVDSMGPDSKPTIAEYPNVKIAPALNFTVKDIDEKTNVNLGRYQGDVIMVVNTASLCGNTPQYADLQAMYDKYKEKGFTILAFPANDFGKQEPGTNKEIKEFCTSKYKVTFPVFSKIVVKGEGQAPLYKYLTEKETNPKYPGDIEWNFAKFLINRNGEIIARFKATTKPSDPVVANAVKAALKEPIPGKPEEKTDTASIKTEVGDTK